MMKIRTVPLVAALFMASVLPLMARVIYDTGPCPGGGTWIVVTTLDDKGRVTSIRGTNCAGVTWTGHCDIVTISDDPTGQIDPGMPIYYHPGENGSWVRYTVNENGMMRSMWGRDVEGLYWATTNFSANLL